MKKLLSVVLTLCIVLTSMFGVLTTYGSATTTTPKELVPEQMGSLDAYEVGDQATLWSSTAAITLNGQWFTTKSAAGKICADPVDSNNKAIQLTGASSYLYIHMPELVEAIKTIDTTSTANVVFKLNFRLYNNTPTTTSNQPIYSAFRSLNVSADGNTTTQQGNEVSHAVTPTTTSSDGKWEEMSVDYSIEANKLASVNGFQLRLASAASNNTIDYLLDDISLTYSGYTEVVSDGKCPDYLQDFEDYTVVQTFGSTIITGSNNSKVIKVPAGKRFAVNPETDSTFAKLGYKADDIVYVSFDYRWYGAKSGTLTFRGGKAVDGTDKFYSNTMNNISLTATTAPTESDATWQNMVVELKIPADSTGVIALGIISTLVTTEFDNIRFFRKTAISVTGEEDATQILPEVDANATKYGGTEVDKYDLANARIGDYFKFKTTSSVGEVKYGDKTLTPDADGVYTIVVAEGKALNLTASKTKPADWEYKGYIYNDFESDGQIHNKTYVSVVDVDGNKVMCYNNTNTTAKGGAIAVNPSAILPSFQELGLVEGDTFGVSFMGQNFTPDSDPWFQVYSFLEQDDTSGSLEALGGITIYAEDYQGYTKYYTYEGETAAQSAKGIVLYFNTKSSKAYIDDVMIYPTTKLTITGDKKYIIWSDDEFKYAGENEVYDPANARVGDWYSFTLAGITADVTYGDEELLPDENGVYTFKVEKGKTLNIVKTGIARIDTTLDDDVTDNTVRILAIGNSYTNDATAMLPEIALAEGKDLRVGQATIGGSTLERHYTNLTENNASYTFQYNDKGSAEYTKFSAKITLETALYATDWDYVTIQQASPASSRDYETYFAPYLETVIGAIKEYAPNAQIMVHETWAYSEVKSQHFGVNTLGKESYSQIDMYEDIVANYKQLAVDVCTIANQTECKIIPTGTAFRIARSQLNNYVLNRDNNPGHANFLGRLAGAYCYYRTIFGESLVSYDASTSSHIYKYMSYPINMPYDHDGDTTTTDDVYSDTIAIPVEQRKAYIPTILASVEKACEYEEQGEDLAIPDAAKTVKAENGGVSIRLESATKGQALRFKSSVPVAEKGKGYDDGYKLVEYGSLVVKTEYIGKAALVYDGVYGTYNKAPVKAVAYNTAGEDTIFAQDENDVVYTVAVNNIALANYGTDITVRAYAIYKNEETGHEYYIYSDEVQTGSIFSVMEAIETTYAAYEAGELTLDEAAVDTLKTDYSALIENAAAEVKEAYEDWKAQ